jgi:hypothetical protein
MYNSLNMRFIEDLCPPALLYLIFLVIQLGLDASMGLWITFVIKFLFGIAAVVVLDMFCGIGLGVVSWFLVATPFIVTSLATAISLGLDMDNVVLSQLSTREKFYNESKMELVPAASNEITTN